MNEKNALKLTASARLFLAFIYRHYCNVSKKEPAPKNDADNKH